MEQVEQKPEVIAASNNVQEKVEQPVKAQAEESEKEINWKKFKEARALERKQAEEVLARAAQKEAELVAVKAALEAVVNKPQQNQSYADQEESEEQRIDKRVNAALAQREAQLHKERADREAQEMPQRLVQMHGDFNQVCNASNLDYLEFHYPEVAAGFKHMPESLDKWTNIYKAVKRFVPNTDIRKDQAKAETNLKKPQSLSNSGLAHDTQTRTTSILTEDRRAENWARMQKAMKGLS